MKRDRSTVHDFTSLGSYISVFRVHRPKRYKGPLVHLTLSNILTQPMLKMIVMKFIHIVIVQIIINLIHEQIIIRQNILKITQVDPMDE